MTYARVIPRDLFNEGDLLNCLGRLWIKLDERRGHDARMRHRHEDGPFNIDQDPSDGSISVENVLLKIDGRPDAHLFRPLNARSKWPLWCRVDNEDLRVLTEDGDLTDEFERLIGLRPKCERCDDTGVEPARMTHDAGGGEGEDLPCSACQQ